MKQILVYGDSLSWGIIPGTRDRLAFDQRWPGVMELALCAAGKKVRVIEDCLNGRRTVWEDPFKPGRNGLIGLAQRIELNSPLALVMVMLGTNDFQSMHDFNAWHSSQGLLSLISTIRTAPVEPGMPVPPILVVAPPPVRVPKGTMAPKFADAARKSLGLAIAYHKICEEVGCHFFDAGSAITSSEVDGVHIDAAEHMKLGQELARVVSGLLAS
ncbi:MAG: SGNH/GDSL hydrolase family protein [Gammaproteobacteria bacterium]